MRRMSPGWTSSAICAATRLSEEAKKKDKERKRERDGERGRRREGGREKEKEKEKEETHRGDLDGLAVHHYKTPVGEELDAHGLHLDLLHVAFVYVAARVQLSMVRRGRHMVQQHTHTHTQRKRACRLQAVS